ncbi:hypothetical protein [Limosilactobacillus reuteri]|nr:hypothetical protein [Limosilactobacillus reuteri]
MKLVLLAYSYGNVSCRKIERFARENIVALWLNNAPLIEQLLDLSFPTS